MTQVLAGAVVAVGLLIVWVVPLLTFQGGKDGNVSMREICVLSFCLNALGLIVVAGGCSLAVLA